MAGTSLAALPRWERTAVATAASRTVPAQRQGVPRRTAPVAGPAGRRGQTAVMAELRQTSGPRRCARSPQQIMRLSKARPSRFLQVAGAGLAPPRPGVRPAFASSRSRAPASASSSSLRASQRFTLPSESTGSQRAARVCLRASNARWARQPRAIRDLSMASAASCSSRHFLESDLNGDRRGAHANWLARPSGAALANSLPDWRPAKPDARRAARGPASHVWQLARAASFRG